MNAIGSSPGLFFRFSTYLWRWLLFGAVGGLVTPVATADGEFGQVKLLQVAFGLLFGLVCAIVFTLLQNTLNRSRNRGISWAVLIGTWLGVKFIFYAASLGLGA